jgi:Copper binding periplasmic protein CusF
MRGWGRGFAAVVGMCVWAGGAAAASVESAELAFVSDVRELTSVEGQIAAVDPAQGTLTLQQDGSVLVMRVDAGTTIFLAGRTGRLAELRAGQRVRAAYEQSPDGRVPVAQWIELAASTP